MYCKLACSTGSLKSREKFGRYPSISTYINVILEIFIINPCKTDFSVPLWQFKRNKWCFLHRYRSRRQPFFSMGKVSICYINMYMSPQRWTSHFYALLLGKCHFIPPRKLVRNTSWCFCRTSHKYIDYLHMAFRMQTGATPARNSLPNLPMIIRSSSMSLHGCHSYVFYTEIFPCSSECSAILVASFHMSEAVCLFSL